MLYINIPREEEKLKVKVPISDVLFDIKVLLSLDNFKEACFIFINISFLILNILEIS